MTKTEIAKTMITNFKAVSRQDGYELLQILDRACQWGGGPLQHVLKPIWQLGFEYLNVMMFFDLKSWSFLKKCRLF